MSLPINLIFVRHGQSEGNKANQASREGDNKFFTPEFRDKHSREFRLTDKGIRQAQAAGEWLRANVTIPFDRFYVSDYIRAKETAYYLQLPNASWRVEFHLRERDTALMDNCPDDVKSKLFTLEQRQHELDPFLSYPAGGGESIAVHCLRLKTSMITHWARECSEMSVITVCHGHVMRAIQLELEDLGHDDFIRLDSSENPEDKIMNCQIHWYSRRDPATQQLFPYIVAVRSICPLNSDTGLAVDYGWRRITRNRYSNDDLLREVTKYPRQIC